jgi:glycopeptide antibiotics resistance protein
LRKPLLVIALAGYLILLTATSLWPKPVDGQGLLAIITSDLLNFASTVSWLSWIQYNQLEAIANVVLYIPLGIFLVLLLNKTKLWVLCLLPVLVSLSAEVSQRLFLPDRYATVNDVFYNALGGVLGVFIAASIRRKMKSSK